jgi:hypothetical protein
MNFQVIGDVLTAPSRIAASKTGRDELSFVRVPTATKLLCPARKIAWRPLRKARHLKACGTTLCVESSRLVVQAWIYIEDNFPLNVDTNQAS